MRFSAKSCSSAHYSLRTTLKHIARKHCRAVHGSGKINTLRQENYTKISCEKKKQGNKTVNVTAEGTLTWLCS